MLKSYQVIIMAVIGGIVLALAAIGGWRLFESKRAEQAAYRLEQELMRPYQEDRVGGRTPEETFQMFLDALRKEDIDLAAKYFVVDKQEEWRRSFMKIKEQGEWQNMVEDVSRAKEVQRRDSGVLYEAIGGEGLVTVSLDIVRQFNGVWKIKSL